MIKLQGEVYKSTIIIGYFKAIFSITVKKKQSANPQDILEL